MGPPERKTPREYSMQEIIEYQHQAAVSALTDIAALPDLSLAIQRRLWAADNTFVTLALTHNPALHPALQDEMAHSRTAYLLAEGPYITQTAQNILIDNAFQDAESDRGLCLRRLIDNPVCTHASRERIFAWTAQTGAFHWVSAIQSSERHGLYRDTPAAHQDEEYEMGDD